MTVVDRVTLETMTMPTTPERLLTTRQASELLGLREATLIAWRSRGTPGRPQPVKVGSKAIRYREVDVLKWRDRETAVRSYGRKQRGSK